MVQIIFNSNILSYKVTTLGDLFLLIKKTKTLVILILDTKNIK